MKECKGGVAIRFQQLLAFSDEWREDEQPDTTFYLLAAIGYLRRAGVESEILHKTGSIEVEVLDKVESILKSVYDFIAGTTLLVRAKGHLTTGALIDFYQDRDDAELAWKMVAEYTDDRHPRNWELVGKMRNILDAVDDEVLFCPDVVKELRSIGTLELLAHHYDPDFFWWLPGEREGCYLPRHRQERYLASYSDGLLPSNLKIKFARHLFACSSCQDGQKEVSRFLKEEEG